LAEFNHTALNSLAENNIHKLKLNCCLPSRSLGVFESKLSFSITKRNFIRLAVRELAYDKKQSACFQHAETYHLGHAKAGFTLPKRFT